MAKTDIKVEKQKKKRDSTEIVKKSPIKKVKTTENSKSVNGKESSSKKIKTENGKVKDIQPAKFSAGSIKNILTRAGSDLQISAQVPALMGSAAVQFATYLSQTALQNAACRSKEDENYSIEYRDVAVGVNADPRLEAVHANVPYQLSYEEALKKREERNGKKKSL